MLYDIICPMCMQRYPANNVVFRHSETELKAMGRDPRAYLTSDVYRQAYYASHAIPAAQTTGFKVVDPAYFHEQDKEYHDGLLTGVRCGAGYLMRERVCPYCHNSLYAGAGRMPLQQMSIIGGTQAGKTTFEAAMIYQLMQLGIGCTNNTLNEAGGVDKVVENNIQILLKDSSGELGKLQQGATPEWGSTTDYHGPYIYQIATGFSDPFALAFYDLPGEDFRLNIGRVKNRAPYIGIAQTCLCLIDLANIDTIADVISALNVHFAEEMKNHRVNFALVLYKADRLYKETEVKKVIEPITLGAKSPVDMAQIDFGSMQLEKFVLTTNVRLQGAYNSICAMLGEENVRLFVARSFDDGGAFSPSGCEVPLLWSLAKQGLYPKSKK